MNKQTYEDEHYQRTITNINYIIASYISECAYKSSRQQSCTKFYIVVYCALQKLSFIGREVNLFKVLKQYRKRHRFPASRHGRCRLAESRTTE